MDVKSWMDKYWDHEKFGEKSASTVRGSFACEGNRSKRKKSQHLPKLYIFNSPKGVIPRSELACSAGRDEKLTDVGQKGEESGIKRELARITARRRGQLFGALQVGGRGKEEQTGILGDKKEKNAQIVFRSEVDFPYECKKVAGMHLYLECWRREGKIVGGGGGGFLEKRKSFATGYGYGAALPVGLGAPRSRGRRCVHWQPGKGVVSKSYGNWKLRLTMKGQEQFSL